MAKITAQLLAAFSVTVLLGVPAFAQQSESSKPRSQSGFDDIAEFGGDEVCFELAGCGDDEARRFRRNPAQFVK